jgi:guanylate kinase
MNEGNYLKLYSEAHNVLNEATGVVVTNTKPGAMTAESMDELKKRLQSQKDEVDNEAKAFTSKKPFQGYSAQHEAVTELLQKESNILGLAIQVLNNPLDEGLDSLLEEGKDTAQQIKNLSGQISVPNTVMTLDDDITVLPQQLKAYVLEQRKLEEERKRLEAERQARLKELNDFFAEMDSAISQYNNAKSNLGGMMESARKSNIIWADYFKVLDQAKSDRSSVRYKVNNIKAPKGTDDLKREFLDVLDNALRYCDVMRIRANLEFNHYYYDAYKKKEESDSIDKNVQNSYASFIENYNSRKEEMLRQ